MTSVDFAIGHETWIQQLQDELTSHLTRDSLSYVPFNKASAAKKAFCLLFLSPYFSRIDRTNFVTFD